MNKIQDYKIMLDKLFHRNQTIDLRQFRYNAWNYLKIKKPQALKFAQGLEALGYLELDNGRVYRTDQFKTRNKMFLSFNTQSVMNKGESTKWKTNTEE